MRFARVCMKMMSRVEKVRGFTKSPFRTVCLKVRELGCPTILRGGARVHELRFLESEGLRSVELIIP